MSSNDITGDPMTTKPLSGEAKARFDENFDRIFGKYQQTSAVPHIPKEYRDELLKKQQDNPLEQEWPL